MGKGHSFKLAVFGCKQISINFIYKKGFVSIRDSLTKLKRTYFILALVACDIIAIIALLTILNRYIYYLPILGVLLGALISNVLPEKQPQPLKPRYDKIELALLSLFVVFTIFLFANFTINLFNITNDSNIFFILLFVDFMIAVSAAAHQADRKSQWKKDHPT